MEHNPYRPSSRMLTDEFRVVPDTKPLAGPAWRGALVGGSFKPRKFGSVSWEVGSFWQGVTRKAGIIPNDRRPRDLESPPILPIETSKCRASANEIQRLWPYRKSVEHP